jgi:hypothetical protein
MSVTSDYDDIDGTISDPLVLIVSFFLCFNKLYIVKPDQKGVLLLSLLRITEVFLNQSLYQKGKEQVLKDRYM